MMKAAHVAEYYTAYLEGNLPEALREDVARHLEACPRCAAELEEMRVLVAGLREMPEIPLPADFAAGVRARLARRHPASPWWLRLPALAGGTLAAAVLALAIFVVLPYFHAPVSPRVQIAEGTRDTHNDTEMTAPNGDKTKAFKGQQGLPSPPTAPKPSAAAQDPFAGSHAKTFKNGPAAATQQQPTVGNDRHYLANTETASNPSKSLHYNRVGRLEANAGAESRVDQPAPGLPLDRTAAPSAHPEEKATASGMMKATPPGAMPPPSITAAASPSGAPGPMGPAGPAAATVSTTPVLADAASSDQVRTMSGDTAIDTVGVRTFSVGALTLRSVMLKDAVATVTVYTTAAAPTDLVIQTLEPAGGDGQGFPLSPDMRTAAFTLPLRRGGSVVELTLKAGRAERAILVMPDRSAPQPLVSLRPQEEPITAVLRRLAVAGHLAILCSPQFIEDKEASFTVKDATPMVALSDLAARRGCRATKVGNIVTLAPKTAAP